MRVLALPILREFWSDHPDAEQPLKTWFTTLEQVDPTHFDALKQTFGSVDLVPDKTDSLPWHVFDIGGNKYRILCKLSYRTGYALIKHVLTHKAYDQWTKDNR